MCPRFLFVDTNKSVHKGHHPHSHTRSTHGRKRTLTLAQRNILVMTRTETGLRCRRRTKDCERCVNLTVLGWSTFRLREGSEHNQADAVPFAKPVYSS